MDPIEYGREPVFALCTDSVPGADLWLTAVAAIGGRAKPPIDIGGAIAVLDMTAEPDVVLVDIGRDAPGTLDALLDRLDLAAAQGVHASVIALSPPLIDVVAARITHPDVTLLCDPTPLERAAAIGIATARPARPVLRERSEESPLQLRRLSEEVGRIARVLAELSSAQVTIEPGPSPDRPTEIMAAMPDVAIVRAFIRTRRMRDQFFPSELFADPAWDMLLDLFLARIERRSIAVSSLCIAASVPPTTALRWIKRLTDEEFFIRTADPRDGRRIFIDLSPMAVDAMAAYFQAIARSGLTRCSDGPGGR